MSMINKIIVFLTLSVSSTVNTFKAVPKMSTSSIISSSSLAIASLPIADQDVHSLARTAFDVLPLIVDPEDTIVIRVVAMAAKTFAVTFGLSSETLNYDDLAFNGIALTVSVSLFSKSFVPVIKTLLQGNAENNPYYLDNKNAYRRLFEPLGLSELNFNILNANGAFDWIDIEPTKEVTLSESERKTFQMRTDLKCLTKTVLDDNIYWLSDGSVQVSIGDNNVKEIERGDGYKNDYDEDIDEFEDDEETDLIFGNVFGTNFIKNNQNNEETEDTPPSTTLKKWVKAGDHGARLLRINGDRVFELMENDGKLSSCIQNLVFIGVCHELRDLSNGEFDEECEDAESCTLNGACDLDNLINGEPGNFDECML